MVLRPLAHGGSTFQKPAKIQTENLKESTDLMIELQNLCTIWLRPKGSGGNFKVLEDNRTQNIAAGMKILMETLQYDKLLNYLASIQMGYLVFVRLFCSIYLLATECLEQENQVVYSKEQLIRSVCSHLFT